MPFTVNGTGAAILLNRMPIDSGPPQSISLNTTMSENATATIEGAPAEAAPSTAPTSPPAPGGFMTATPASAPPAGDGAPAAPAHFFGEHIAKDGKFVEGWTEQLRTNGFERLATKAALAGDEASLFRSMDDMLGLVGKKAGPSYPKAGASDEDVSAYRREAGVPDSAEAYNLKPSALPEGMEWSDEDAKAYGEIFHKHHVPAAAAQELVNRHLETIGNMATAGKDQLMQQIGKFAEASESTFQKEWGSEYDTRLEANRAFVTTRFTPEELADPVIQAALSHPSLVRMIDTARRELRGQATLPGSGSEPTAGSHSPRQQAYEIMGENPGWDRNPDLVRRVNELYALDAAQAKRKK